MDLDPDLHLIRYVFCSVVDLDPNPHGSAFIWLYWILIWICIKNGDPDPNLGAWGLTKIKK
jgi:hypothetical protein